MPNILILGPDLKAPGGVANYFNALNLTSQENIRYMAVNNATKQPLLLTGIRLLKNYCKYPIELLKHKTSIVHINPSLDIRSFYRDSVFIILANLVGRKTVIFFRGWEESFEEKIKQTKLLSILFQIGFAKADYYIVLGNIFKRKLIALGVPANAKFSVETTVADSTCLDRLNLKNKYLSFQKEIKILFLSRTIKEKGVFIAIEAFQKFSEIATGRLASLIIAGDGPDLAKSKEFVKKNKIANVKFSGYIKGERKLQTLLESHIMLLPSFSEGLPNVILEGMLYGMPVIAKITGGIPEIIKQGINGYLSESYDPAVYADFILKLAVDPTLFETISVTNNRIAKEKFTTEKVRERILRIYDSID